MVFVLLSFIDTGPVRFLRLALFLKAKAASTSTFTIIGMFLRTVGYWGWRNVTAPKGFKRVVTAIRRINLYPVDKLLPTG